MSRDVLKHDILKDRLGKTEFRFNTIIGSITDPVGLEYALYGVDYVIHAAAIKYIVECEYNTRQTMAINCEGTQNIVDAAIKNGVKKTLLISTDKSVQAINTYGVSKAMAEKIIINGNNLAGKRQSRFSVCRYGNVISSNGSVIPLYKKMIADGAMELPVTHPDMTRFFYKMDDAVQFILNGLEIMQGGETYVPKIPSARIIDIPEALNMPYYISGIRPGEKLHECMIPKEVAHLTLDCGEYYLVKPTYSFNDSINYEKNGKLVSEGLEYNSKDNDRYYSVEEIKNLIKGEY
jgi:UDP-N-acetylglucosamine 4,6-dehydratase